MKWQKKNQTATKGVLFVEEIVNAHGSIFRPVHQETDIGIDGYIELVQSENSTGRIIAVQIKCGASYFEESTNSFHVNADQEHLGYWRSYPVPVILICYQPSLGISAWTCIQSYLEYEAYHGRTQISRINVQCFKNEFNIDALNKGIAELARENANRRILIECVDKCLTGTNEEKLQGLSILRSHSDSRDSRIVAFLARKLLFDEDKLISDLAIYTLAYHVGRIRWSFNPSNRDELALSDYAASLCLDFTESEYCKLIRRAENEYFDGPDAMGERVFDLISCSSDSIDVLRKVAADVTQPMSLRVGALYMRYGCDDEELLDQPELVNDPQIGDVYAQMLINASGELGDSEDSED
jgi:hypothetical protein